MHRLFMFLVDRPEDPEIMISDDDVMNTWAEQKVVENGHYNLNQNIGSEQNQYNLDVAIKKMYPKWRSVPAEERVKFADKARQNLIVKAAAPLLYETVIDKYFGDYNDFNMISAIYPNGQIIDMPNSQYARFKGTSGRIAMIKRTPESRWEYMVDIAYELVMYDMRIPGLTPDGDSVDYIKGLKYTERDAFLGRYITLIKQDAERHHKSFPVSLPIKRARDILDELEVSYQENELDRWDAMYRDRGRYDWFVEEIYNLSENWDKRVYGPFSTRIGSVYNNYRLFDLRSSPTIDYSESAIVCADVHT